MNLPLTRRFPKLTNIADFLFRNNGNGLLFVCIVVYLLINFFVFVLTKYSLLAKFTAALVIFSFVLCFIIMPIVVAIALLRADCD